MWNFVFKDLDETCRFAFHFQIWGNVSPLHFEIGGIFHYEGEITRSFTSNKGRVMTLSQSCRIKSTLHNSAHLTICCFISSSPPRSHPRPSTSRLMAPCSNPIWRPGPKVKRRSRSFNVIFSEQKIEISKIGKTWLTCQRNSRRFVNFSCKFSQSRAETLTLHPVNKVALSCTKTW